MASQELSHSSLFDDAPLGPDEFSRRLSLTSVDEATNSVCDPQANGSPPLIARDGSAGSHVDLAQEGSVTFASDTNTELANLVTPENPSSHSSKARTPSPYITPSENNRSRSYAGRDEAVTPQMPPPLVTKRTTPILSRSNPPSRPESNGHSNNSYSPSRRSHHDFHEALKVDELAAKVETLTKVLGEREAENVTLTSRVEELQKENDRLRRQLEAGGHVPDEENSEKYQKLWEEKEALEVELRAIRRVAEEEKEEKEERVAEQRASASLEFDKNDPNLLRRKIEDLQAQVHDLQEANESTSVMLAHHRPASSGKPGLDAASERLLLGHDPSAGSLRREIESLRADLDALRHRNEVVVAENEALRRQEPQLNVHRRDILATADRHSRPTFRSSSRADNRGSHLDLQRHQRELEGDLEAMQRLRSQIREEQQNSAAARAGGHLKAVSYANLSSFENDFRSPYSLSRSFFSPGEDFAGGSRRLAGGGGGGSAGGGPQVDVRQRSSSVDRPPARRESREERPSSSPGVKEDRADARSSGSTSSILSDAERELEDMKRVTSTFDGGELTALRRSTRVPPLPANPAGLRSVSPPPLPTQHNRTALAKSGFRPDESRSAMFSLSGRHPFAPRNASEVQLGDIVKFTRQGGRICKGVAHFVGHLPGRNDVYIGVELEHEDGKHDGTYEGRRYFQCKTNKGVFVAFNKIVMCYGMRPF